MDKKSNGGLKCLVVVLFLCVLGLGGYIIYDKAIAKDEAPKVENNCQNVANSSQTKTEDTNTPSNQALQVLSTKVGTFIIAKDGSVYYRKIVDKYEGAEIKVDSFSSIATQGKYKVEDYITNMEDDKKIGSEFEGYKLNIANINSAYEVATGNSGASEIIYFVTKDGKVNELSFSANTDKVDVKLSKDTCLKPNIVSVLSSRGFDGAETIFVDTYGNKYTNTELVTSNNN